MPELLRLLNLCNDTDSQMELSLSLARILGEETRFIQILRGAREDAGTSLSQAISGLQNKFEDLRVNEESNLSLVGACAEALAHNDMTLGARLLVTLIREVLKEQTEPYLNLILSACADWIDAHGHARIEYFIIAILALSAVSI